MTLKPSAAWMEKYRPGTIDDMIWSSQEDKQMKDHLKRFYDGWWGNLK